MDNPRVNVGETTHRDLERAALRDLVALAGRCADEESLIDSEHDSAIAHQRESFEQDAAEINSRFDKLESEMRQKYRERLDAIEQAFQVDRGRCEESLSSATKRLVAERDSAEHRLQEDRSSALWLADSLLEGAQTRLREQAAQAKEEYQRQVDSVDELVKRAHSVLFRFGRPSSELRLDYAAATSEPASDEQAPADRPATLSFSSEFGEAERLLDAMAGLRAPGLLSGVSTYIGVIVLCALVAVVTKLLAGVDWLLPVAIAAGSTLLLLLGIGLVLQVIGRRQVRSACIPLAEAVVSSRRAATAQFEAARIVQRDEYLAAQAKHRAERAATEERVAPLLTQVRERYQTAIRAINKDRDRQTTAIVAARDRRRQRADEKLPGFIDDLHNRRQARLKAAQDDNVRRLAEIESATAERLGELEKRWLSGLAAISKSEFAINDGGKQADLSPGSPAGELHDWDDPRWENWTPPERFAGAIRFGELAVDLEQLTNKAPKRLKLPARFTVPALLAFPHQASLLIHADHSGRARAIRTLQMVMLRLLTCIPPGRARFTIIDPVGLGQNFAGFMHLADHDESLVGNRIWSERDHIERQLADLTEHMETVIQKYLRNEFATIDEYNAQAGELAEPYRFLVIADYPIGFDSEVFRRLASIASAGPRCGVYMLIFRDTRQQLPADSHQAELESHSVNLVQAQERFTWRDEVFGRFPLTLDRPPGERFLTRMLDVVGRAARESKRVEVPFSTIAPSDGQAWSATTAEGLSIPIGRAGATRNQSLRLGHGVAQHCLIAGKTGAGKSNLLHVIITNAALWHSPAELEFYLVDFKKGVEFKTFATNVLPHARAVAVESDREFGFSVLQRVDAELTRRGELFRAAGVQDLPAYLATTGTTLPRTLLIIDEFQEFFSEDDRLAQDSALLIDRLVRQGRAFGIHVILGSQTIGGTSGLSRSTLGQMAVRIALQCSEADSQLILSDDNSAARLLGRPGEAIYNDAGGLVEGNSPFQVAYLPDDVQDGWLSRIDSLARQREIRTEPPVVFEGNAPAAITKNVRLMRLLDEPSWPASCPVPLGWIGEPVAIKEPTAVAFRRQSGANMLVIGQHEESALAVIASTIISLAAQQPPTAARFVIFDGTGADSPVAGMLQKIADVLPHQTTFVPWRSVPDAINELAEELGRRQADESAAEQSIYVLFHGLQRYRMLRRQEDDFSMSFGKEDEPAKPRPDKQFADLLREGAPLGMHVLAWADAPVTVERTLDRAAMREFDNRVLFQMSASDSSNLIDSPAANKLGPYRALAFSEELGVLEKLRPYARPSADWLAFVRQHLAARQADNFGVRRL